MSDDLHASTSNPAARSASPAPRPTMQSSPVQPGNVSGSDVTLREAARHSRVPGRRSALRTPAFGALAGFGLLVFGALTILVTTGLTADADLVATQSVQGIGLPLFGPLMVGISQPGFFPQFVVLIGGAVSLFWRAGYRTESRFALVASASVLLTEVFKRLVGRPRPDAGLVSVIEGATGNSFPSGHTLFYVTFFGFLAYVAYAQLQHGRLRTALLWISAAMILLVGPSRIWMGQHWASDVLASYALGLTYLIGLIWLYGRRQLHMRDPVDGRQR